MNHFEYREYQPSADLAPYVRCFWTACSPQDSVAHDWTRRLIPDGTVDLCIHPQGSGEHYSHKAHHVLRAEHSLLGVQTTFSFLRPLGPLHSLNVQFRPGAASSFLEVDLVETADRIWSLDDIIGRKIRLMEPQVLDPNVDVREKILSLERLLRACARPRRQARMVHHAIRMIQGTQGSISIESLADEVGYTRQHLRRLFLEHVGMSPRHFARITRFSNVYRRIESQPRDHAPDWATLGLEHGYYDQSHFISEFKEFSGTSPDQFWRTPFEMFHSSKNIPRLAL